MSTVDHVDTRAVSYLRENAIELISLSLVTYLYIQALLYRCMSKERKTIHPIPRTPLPWGPLSP